MSCCACEHRQFLVGLQVDATQPLAVALEARRAAVDIAQMRRRRAPGFSSASGEAILRRHLERFADAAGFFLAAGARALQLGLNARLALARLADLRPGERRACAAARNAVSACGQFVGRRAALALGAFQAGQQLVALLVDQGGQVGHAVEFVQRARRAARAASPICCSAPAERVVQRSRSAASVRTRSAAQRAFPLQRGQLRLGLGGGVAGSRRRVSCAAASCGSRSSASSSSDSAVSISSKRPLASIKVVLGDAPWLRSATRCASSVSRAARSIVVSSSRVADSLHLRLTPQLRAAACSAASAACHLLGGVRLGVGEQVRLFAACFSRAREIRQAVALGDALRGRRHAVGGSGKAVPAPQVALARDQALAGPQMRLQPRAVVAVDDADLAQAALQLRRRLRRNCDSGSTSAGKRAVLAEAGSISRQCTAASSLMGASRSSPSAAPSAAS